MRDVHSVRNWGGTVVYQGGESLGMDWDTEESLIWPWGFEVNAMDTDYHKATYTNGAPVRNFHIHDTGSGGMWSDWKLMRLATWDFDGKAVPSYYECKYDGTPRTGAIEQDNCRIASGGVRLALRDEYGVRMLYTPDMQTWNKFGNEYSRQAYPGAGGGTQLRGAIHFTASNGSQFSVQKDAWDAYSVDGAQTMAVPGRMVYDAALEDRNGTAVGGWKPMLKLNCADLAVLLNLTGVIAALDAYVDALGGQYNTLLADVIAGNTGAAVVATAWVSAGSGADANVCDGDTTISASMTDTPDDMPTRVSA